MMQGMPLLDSVPDFGVCCFSQSWQGAKNWEEHAPKQGLCVGFETVPKKTDGDVSPSMEELRKYCTDELFPIYEPEVLFNHPFFFLSRVKYEDKPNYKVNILPLNSIMDRAILNVLKKDKKKYEYEDEVRVFAIEEKIPDDEQFRCDEGIKLHARWQSVKEVTFAQDISDTSKNKVIDLLKSREHGLNNIQFYRCTGVDKESKMQREQIQP